MGAGAGRAVTCDEFLRLCLAAHQGLLLSPLLSEQGGRRGEGMDALHGAFLARLRLADHSTCTCSPRLAKLLLHS